MNFNNVNKFNALVNTISGNCFPVTANIHDYTLSEKLYSYFTMFIFVLFVFGTFQKLLSTTSLESGQLIFSTFLSSLETLMILAHMNLQRDKFHLLIKRLNKIFNISSKIFDNLVSRTIEPVMKIFKGYYSMCLSSVIIWSMMPLLNILEKDVFTDEDFQVPINFFSLFTGEFHLIIFLLGIFFETVAHIYLVAKKAAINLYLIHFVKVSTANYLFLRHQLSEAFHAPTESELMKELRIILDQQRIMFQVTKEFPAVFAINITTTYLHATLELCSVIFMIATASGGIFEQLMIASYTIGVIMELYLICYSIDVLKQARLSIVDQAFHEPWYEQKLYLQKIIIMIIFASLMECRLSSSRTFDLSLPIFKIILSNAYSASLILLNVK